ncbi:glycosyltransferase family 4 protein [Clostridium perfringens]|uniref:glycosyltransferase family 4 protein n=1 Tax=Clostridium perfringens TaxID=1502 RepID=UPI001C8530E6|nr:glycosyltransferase family 4 protein [Clostridium perfringens]MDK0562933.1 glycosyltransferase family 4 protein [Clostridium perfringens]MDK0694945.1 glycosyltransferase family 4 protein [Clostridium perfringens]MDM0519119.1 glycosyltransferase family 4 protein [Clostridium perfringens]MDM0662786.1 glycosyltransferase family 4 protein [Clostridium perfringens]
MIIVFTSIESGGILQLANQITESLEALGQECMLYVPKGSREVCSNNLVGKIIEYNTPKTINPYNANIKSLAKDIEGFNPDLLLIVDDAIRSNLLINNIDKEIAKVIFVHDVTPHLQEFSMRKYLVEKIRGIYRFSAFSSTNKIVLLSKNSENKFIQKYGHYKNKRYVLPLGAHIIPANKEMPIELKDSLTSDFALFFGRIDKYKGVDRLVEAHCAACENQEYKIQLVIAGKNISKKPLNILQASHTLMLDRYISDGEMQWLFEHCKFVVLPYYEASQSGVLPIAYKYGKPVIVSNISGLKELVISGKTGEVFSDTKDLENKLQLFASTFHINQNKSEIQNFYNENYDWCKNLKRLIALVKKDIEEI